jgi:DNA-binding MarR family transcriptional regulator
MQPVLDSAPTCMTRTTTRRTQSSRGNTERLALLSTRALIDSMRARYLELERQTGASITMHRALACIAGDPGISASALATALGMKRPAVSHLLKGLAQRGWIDRLRTGSDQRSVQLRLTAAGAQTVEATAGRAVGTLQRAVAQLSDAEVIALQTGLTALLRELPAMTGTVPPRPRRK